MKFVGLCFFIIGAYGYICSSSTFITCLVALEMIFISMVYTSSIVSVDVDDVQGQLLSLTILSIAAAESAVGLAILVQYYRVRGAVDTRMLPLLKS